MNFVGIDYSTRKVAMAVLGEDQIVVLSYQAPKKLTGTDATKDMMLTFTGWCAEGFLLDAVVYIESPIMGRMLNAQTTVGMGIAAGALMQASTFYGGVSTRFVAPSFWKKQVTGNGGYDKAQVGQWLQDARPDLLMHCGNDDEVDAMCMALLAQELSSADM